MNRFKIRFGVILAILLTITICSACGPGAEPTPPTPTPTPPSSANQPPEISSLTPAQTQAYPSDMIEIQCNASDADGDTISYEWSTTGGKFTGTGPTVSWVAPEQYGDYTITVIVKDGKGGIAQATVTMSVVRNMDPVISSLVADPVTVLPQGKATITCVASDPDGDILNYSWKASDGSVTGAGNTVTWIAPDREGGFTVTVIVDDGKGGQNAADVSVTVVLTEKTETFTPVPSETGTVSSKGDKDTSRAIAGDDANNIGYHAFWSFNLYSLRGTEVKDAKLTFTMKREPVGEPFHKITGLGGLHIFAVRYEPGQLPNFSPEEYSELHPDIWQLPTVIDVTDLVSKIGQRISVSDRLQIEASFMNQTNGNHIRDYVEWETVTLTVTYAEK